MSYIFTSESVSEGHPDKLCDRVSDTVLDLFLAAEPEARVACETFATTNRVILGGEVRASEHNLPSIMAAIEPAVRAAVRSASSCVTMDELTAWCTARGFTAKMTAVVVEAYVDLDGLRSCADHADAMEEALAEEGIPPYAPQFNCRWCRALHWSNGSL